MHLYIWNRRKKVKTELIWGVVGLVQMTHWTTYMGYRVIMQTGFRMNRQDYTGRPTRVTGAGFATVIAGIQG